MNLRIAAYYAAGAFLLVPLIVYGWPWTGILIWPLLSMTALVAAYLGVGPAIYGKRNGLLPIRTRLFLAPTLLGQHLSLLHYRRHSRPWDEAVPGVLMGRVLTEGECARLIRLGAPAVLDLTAEFSETAPLRTLTYRNVPLLDLTAPTASLLQDAVAFISEQRAAGRTVYVHCKVGYSRTATAVGAYLIASGQCSSLDDVLAHLRSARPGIVIREEAVEALRSFRATGDHHG
jgi:protein phosphatase